MKEENNNLKDSDDKEAERLVLERQKTKVLMGTNCIIKDRALIKALKFKLL